MQNKKIVLVVVFFFLLFFIGTYIFVSQNKIEKNNVKKDEVVIDKEKETVDYALSLAHKGSLEFKEKEYGQQAVSIFESILKKEPNNIQALLGIGYAYEIMEEYEKSLNYYEKALKLDSKNAAIYNRIGHMYDLSEGVNKAESFYRKSLEINPNLIDAKINIARVYLRQNKSEEAMSILKEVYASQDINGRAKAEIGYLLFANAFDNDDYEKAKIYIEKAKDNDPTLPMVWVGMGMSKLYEVRKLTSSDGAMQLYEESLGYFDKASKLYVYQTAAYYWKGRAVMIVGDYENAVNLFRTAKEVVKSDITLMYDQRIKFEEEIDFYLAEAQKKTIKESSFFRNLFIKTADAAACCSYWGWVNGVWTNTCCCVTWCETQAQENAIYLELVAGTGDHAATVTGNTVTCINGASATYVPIDEPAPSDPPAPSPVNGACDTARAKIYSAADNNFSGNWCSSGTESFPNGTPSFPNHGQTTVNWSCLGSNGGTNATTCNAGRKFPAPAVDLRINGSNGPVNPNLDNGDDLDISWTVISNATGATTYCSKSGSSWGTGQIIPSKGLVDDENSVPLPSGSFPISNSAYSLTCHNGNGNSALDSASAADTVLVNVYCNAIPPTWSLCSKQCGTGTTNCTSKNNRCEAVSCGSNDCNTEPCPVTSEWKEVRP